MAGENKYSGLFSSSEFGGGSEFSDYGRGSAVDWDALQLERTKNQAGNAMARGLISPDDYSEVVDGDQKNLVQKIIFDGPTSSEHEITNEATGGFLETLGDTLGIGSIVMASAAQAGTKTLMGKGHFLGNYAEAWANRTSFIQYMDEHGEAIGADSKRGQFWGGLAADILLDPLTWMTLGVTGGAKVGLSLAARSAAKKGTRLASTEAGTKLTANRLGAEIYKLSAQQLQPDFVRWKQANAAEGLSRSEHLLDATEAATWNERIIENSIENFDFLMRERQRRNGLGSTIRSINHRIGQVAGSGKPGFNTVEAGVEAAAGRAKEAESFFPKATADDMFQETASAAFKDRGIKTAFRQGAVDIATSTLGETAGKSFRHVFRWFDRDFGRPPGMVQAVKETENIISLAADKANAEYARRLGSLSGEERTLVSRLVEDGYSWDELGLGTLSGVVDHSEKIRGAVQFVRSEMDSIFKAEKSAGFEIGNVANYLTHVYSLNPQQRELAASAIFRNGEESINSVNKFTQSRLIASIAEGVEIFGKGSMVEDALEILRIRKRASLQMMHRTELNKHIIRQYGIPGLLIQAQNQGMKGSVIRGFLRRNVAGVAKVLNVSQVYQTANGNLTRLGFREGQSERNRQILRFLMRPADDVADDATRSAGRMSEDGLAELERISGLDGITEEVAERILSHTWDKKGKAVKVKGQSIATVIGEALPRTFRYTDTRLGNVGVWTAQKVHKIMRGKTDEFRVDNALAMIDDTGHPQWDMLFERMTSGKSADSFRMSPVLGFFGGLHAYMVKHLDSQLPGFDPAIEQKIKAALVDRLVERAAGVDKGIAIGASKRRFLISKAREKVERNFSEALAKGFSGMAEDITVRKYRPQLSSSLVDLALASRRAAGNFRSDAPAAEWQRKELIRAGVELGFDSDTLRQLYRAMFDKDKVESAAEADLVLELFHTLTDDTVVARMLGTPGSKGKTFGTMDRPRQMGPWTGSLQRVTFSMPLQGEGNILPELLDAANRQGDVGIDSTSKTPPADVSLFDDADLAEEIGVSVAPKVKRNYHRVLKERNAARNELTLKEHAVEAINKELKALPQDMVSKRDQIRRLRRLKSDLSFITTGSKTAKKKEVLFSDITQEERSRIIHDATSDLLDLMQEAGVPLDKAKEIVTAALSPLQRMKAPISKVGVWKRSAQKAEKALEKLGPELNADALAQHGENLYELASKGMTDQAVELGASVGVDSSAIARIASNDLIGELNKLDEEIAAQVPEYAESLEKINALNKKYDANIINPNGLGASAGKVTTQKKVLSKMSEEDLAEAQSLSLQWRKAEQKATAVVKSSEVNPDRAFAALAGLLKKAFDDGDEVAIDEILGVASAVRRRTFWKDNNPSRRIFDFTKSFLPASRPMPGAKELRDVMKANDAGRVVLGSNRKAHAKRADAWKKTLDSPSLRSSRRAALTDVASRNRKMADDASRLSKRQFEKVARSSARNQAAATATRLVRTVLKRKNKEWKESYVAPWENRKELLAQKKDATEGTARAVKKVSKAEQKLVKLSNEIGLSVEQRMSLATSRSRSALGSPLDDAPSPMVQSMSEGAKASEEIGIKESLAFGRDSGAGATVQDAAALPIEARYNEAAKALRDKISETKVYMASGDVDKVVARAKKKQIKELKRKVSEIRDELGYNPTKGSKVDSIVEPREFAKNQEIEVFLPEEVADILKEYRGEKRMRELDGTPMGQAINNILSKYDSVDTYFKSNILLAFTGTWSRNAFSASLMSYTSNGINLLDPHNGFEKMGQFVTMMRYYLYKHTDYASHRGLTQKQVDDWLEKAGKIEVVSRATGRKLTVEQLTEEGMISGVTKSMHSAEAMDIMARGQGIGASMTIGAVAGGALGGPLGALAGAAGGAAIGSKIGTQAPATGPLSALSAIPEQSVGGGVSGVAAGATLGSMAGLAAGAVDSEQDLFGSNPASWTSALGAVAGGLLGVRRPYAAGDQAMTKAQAGGMWGIPVVGKTRRGVDRVTGMLQSQWMPALRAGETATETPFRLAAFLGGFHETGSVMRATDKVTNALNDWNNLSLFEKRVMRRIVPFYTWTKHALAFTFRESINNPGRLSAPHKVAESWLVSQDFDPEDVPEFFHEKLTMLTRVGEDKVDVYSGVGAPQEDVAALVNALVPNRRKSSAAERTQFMSGALSRGPFGVISVLEGAFNTDTFTGRAIQSDADIGYFRDGRRWDDAPGWLQHLVGYSPATPNSKAVVDPNMAWLLGEIPVSRFIDTMKKVHAMSPEEKRNVNTRSLALSFLGVNAYRYDRATQKKYVNRAKVDRLNDLLMTAGAVQGYQRFTEVEPTKKSSRRGARSGRGRDSRFNSR